MLDQQRAEDSASPPTPFDVLGSATGYAGVAAACSFAGYAITHSFPPSKEGLLSLLLLWAALYPAYVSRAALYEQTKLRFIKGEAGAPGWLRKALALQVPLILLTIPIIVWLTTRPPLEVGWRVLIACAPMYSLSLYLVTKWPTDLRLYDFRFRNFFPALATCLPPFVYGFTAPGDWSCPALATAFVLIAWVVALNTPTRKFVRYSLAVLVVLIFVFGWLSVKPDKGCVDLMIFGLLMTLAMGVCEAWRFTARVLNDAEYRPGEYTEAAKRALLGGTNLATGLFLPVFLLTCFHPSATKAYTGLAALLLSAQYILWFADRTPTKKTWWPSAGAMLGFGYPLIIATATTLGRSAAAEARPVPGALMDLPGFVSVIGILGGVVVYVLRANLGLTTNSSTETRASRFVVVPRCWAITCLISAVAGGLLATAVLIINTWSFDIKSDITQRGTILEVLYLIITIAAGAAIFLEQMRSGGDQGAPAATDSRPQDGTVTRQFRILLTASRPGTAFIAGLVVLLVLGRHQPSPWLAAVGAIAFVAATMFGFVVNDIFDLEKDRAAGIGRPIATGVLTLRRATAFGAILAALAYISATPVGGGAFMFGTLVLLLGYTPFAHRVPLAKGFYTACLTALPLMFACSAARVAMPGSIIAAIIIFVAGRECILDVRDVAGDAHWGLRTLPVVLGVRPAWVFGSTLMLNGAVLLVVLVHRDLTRVLAVCAVVAVMTCIVVKQLSIKTQVTVTRMALLSGAVAAALSV